MKKLRTTDFLVIQNQSLNQNLPGSQSPLSGAGRLATWGPFAVSLPPNYPPVMRPGVPAESAPLGGTNLTQPAGVMI